MAADLGIPNRADGESVIARSWWHRRSLLPASDAVFVLVPGS